MSSTMRIWHESRVFSLRPSLVDRIAISSSYWPMVWPSPEAVTLTIDPKRSHLELPVLPSLAGSRAVKFAPPEYATAGSVTVKEPARETRRAGYDIESEIATVHIVSDDGRYIIDDIGTEIAATREKTYSIARNDPSTASTVVACRQEYRRGDWDVRVESEIAVTADRDQFHLTGKIRAYEKGSLFASRDFADDIPRDCM